MLDTQSLFIKEGVLKLKKLHEPKRVKSSPELKAAWGAAKTDQLYTCYLLGHLLLICKFNEKGSKVPYKLVFSIPTSEISTVVFNLNTKAKSGVVINLVGDGSLQLNARDTEDAKDWITREISFLLFYFGISLSSLLSLELQLVAAK